MESRAFTFVLVTSLLAACAGRGSVNRCPDVSIVFPLGESRVDPIELRGCAVLGARIVPDPIAEEFVPPRSEKRFAVELFLDPPTADALETLGREVVARAHAAGDRGWNLTVEVRAGPLARAGVLFGSRPIPTALWPRPLFLITGDASGPRLHLGWLTREEAETWIEASRAPRWAPDAGTAAQRLEGGGAASIPRGESARPASGAGVSPQ